MSNREIEAILKISSKLGNMQALKTLQNELKKVDDQAKAYNEAEDRRNTARNQRNGRGVGRSVGLGAAAAGVTHAVGDFADFERRVERIGITAGASVEETKAATGELQNMAQQFALPLDDATRALEELVAGGMDLKQAFSFLPSVLTAAQASGADTADIARTAQSAAVSLGISAEEMIKAFDLMIVGGKSGKFELKDMAQEIPRLAGLFASAGYTGTDGLMMMIATLQTLREVTADGSTAATQLQDIMIKMNTRETAKRFDEFGINLPEELARAKSEGKDLLQTFIDLSKQAVGGDMMKLPLLFADKELLMGMQTLMSNGENFARFMGELKDVDGAALADFQRIVSGTAADIERMNTGFQQFLNTVGSVIAPVATPIMEAATGFMSENQGYIAGRMNDGDSYLDALIAGNLARALPGGGDDFAETARRGGYVDHSDAAAVHASKVAPDAHKLLGRLPRRPVSQTPVRNEVSLPAPGRSHRDAENQSMMDMARQGSDIADAIASGADQAGSSLKANVAEGGDAAGSSIGDAIRSAMAQAGDALAAKILSAVSSIKVNVGTVGSSMPARDHGASGSDVTAVP